MRGLCAAIFGVLAIALIASTGCSKTGDTCATDSDCGSNQECGYPIGDCSAHGRCVDLPQGPTCDSCRSLCGCEGDIVYACCGEPYGYAKSPATNTAPSADEQNSGTCDVDQDASVDAASE